MSSTKPVQSDPAFEKGTAIVIGGSGGIGAAICVAMAEAGSNVALSYRSNEREANSVVDRVRAFGREAEAAALSLDDPVAVKAYFEAVTARHGYIHTVIYAAGPPLPIKHINMLTPDEWKGVFDADVNGCFNMVWASLPHLKAQGGGSIIALITAAVDMAPPRDILSAAPKAAIEMLIRGVAKEEGRFGIRANCVGPGHIDAGLGRELLGREDSAGLGEKLLRAVPLKRMGEAVDVANAVVFLASSKAAYVTGHSLHVDGGIRI